MLEVNVETIGKLQMFAFIPKAHDLADVYIVHRGDEDTGVDSWRLIVYSGDTVQKCIWFDTDEELFGFLKGPKSNRTMVYLNDLLTVPRKGVTL